MDEYKELGCKFYLSQSGGLLSTTYKIKMFF